MTGFVELVAPVSPADERGRAALGRTPAAAVEADADEPLHAAGPLTAIAFESPLGRMVIEADGLGLRALRWGDGAAAADTATPDVEQAVPLLVEAREQVLAYLNRRLRRFSLPLAPRGTRFQRTVWGFIHEIPFGCMLRYGELAELVRSGPRAAARACAANPLPLIIPCHRVVGGTLGVGGYSAPGGLATKRFLLHLEGGARARGPVVQLDLVHRVDDPAPA